MPMIDVTIVKGSITAEAVQPLLDELAAILLKWEGAPDTEFFREITWVYLHELAHDQLAVGTTREGQQPRFRVDITVPEGALSQRRKAALIAEVHTAVAAAADIDPQGVRALHIWTLVREIPEGSWGAAGSVVHFDDLRKASAAVRLEQSSVSDDG